MVKFKQKSAQLGVFLVHEAEFINLTTAIFHKDTQDLNCK